MTILLVCVIAIIAPYVAIAAAVYVGFHLLDKYVRDPDASEDKAPK